MCDLIVRPCVGVPIKGVGVKPEFKRYIHIKTGNTYYKLFDALDCTNSRADTDTVVYCNEDGMVFVREKKEFEEKFKEAECKSSARIS